MSPSLFTVDLFRIVKCRGLMYRSYSPLPFCARYMYDLDLDQIIIFLAACLSPVHDSAILLSVLMYAGRVRFGPRAPLDDGHEAGLMTLLLN